MTEPVLPVSACWAARARAACGASRHVAGHAGSFFARRAARGLLSLARALAALADRLEGRG